MIKMDKKIIFAFIVVSLFLISGCEGGAMFGKKEEKRPVTDADVRKGFSGLNMEFEKNAPPESVFEGSDTNPSAFPISLRLKNEGAFDIEDNKETVENEGGIVVFGFEKTYVDVVGEGGRCPGGLCKGISIKGKSIYSPAGDEDSINVDASAKKIGAQSEKHPSTILATACYPYNTTLGTSVCIDPDVIGEATSKKACNVQDVTFTEGQGAPVAITKIETRMLPFTDNGVDKIKPHFIIFIENKGNGEVVNVSKLIFTCSSSALKYVDFNVVKITASLPQGDLKCSENSEPGPTTIRLREKEDMIRCTLETEGGVDIGRDAYTSPLKIELEYGYTFTISKNIIIEKVLTH